MGKGEKCSCFGVKYALWWSQQFRTMWAIGGDGKREKCKCFGATYAL